MSFEQFLTENVTHSQAVELLGLKAGWTSADLTDAFRRASRTAHPDRGGSTELMQRLNKAREVLLRDGNRTDWQSDLKSRKEQEQKTWDTIDSEVRAMVNTDAFVAHFEKITGRKYTATVKYPSRMGWSYGYNFSIEVKSTDDEVRANVNMHINTVLVTASLGTADSWHDVVFTVDLFANNRRQVLSRNYRYTRAQTKAIFKDPSVIYPTAKLKRAVVDSAGKKRAFRKSDAQQFLIAKLGAHNTVGDLWYIPVGDGVFWHVERHTFMRNPLWQNGGLYTVNERGNPRNLVPGSNSIAIIPETEEAFHEIVDFKKRVKGKNVEQIKTELFAFLNYLKSKRQS